MERWVWLFFGVGLWAQRADSLWTPNPRTSLVLSLVLPGAGQIYNRAYWKAPIVWGALALPAYLTYQEHQSLREYHRQNRDIFLLTTLVLYGLAAGEAYADAHLYGFRVEAHLSPTGVLLALSW
jgi:hypothetical protein